MRFGNRSTFLSFSDRWIVMPAIEVKAEERQQRVNGVLAAAKVDEWVRDVMSWPDMLHLYEVVSGDRLRPPTTLDVEERVKPVLREAFRRGVLVALRAPLSSAAKQKTEEGVHAVPDKIEKILDAIPKKPPRIVKEKSFLDLQVVNTKGKPLAGLRYKLQLPDGKAETGTFGADARIQKKDIDPGTATLTLLPGESDVFEAEDPTPADPDGDTIVVFLQDDEGQPMANAHYRLRVGSEVREGTADGDGRLEEKGMPSAETCKLQWGPEPTEDSKGEPYVHERDFRLDVEEADDDSAQATA